MKNKPINAIYLGSSEDMANHKYEAYKVADEIHIIYESGHISKCEIQKIRNNLDKYLWTPYIQWI